MAEKNQKEEGQETEKVKEAKVHTIRQKVSKSQWSVERCLKASKRFDTVDAWKKGAPSSFKAAEAHGWVEQCSAHMNKKSYQRSA